MVKANEHAPFLQIVSNNNVLIALDADGLIWKFEPHMDGGNWYPVSLRRIYPTLAGEAHDPEG